MWHPAGDNTNVVGLADNHIIVWDIDTSANTAQVLLML